MESGNPVIHGARAICEDSLLHAKIGRVAWDLSARILIEQVPTEKQSIAMMPFWEVHREPNNVDECAGCRAQQSCIAGTSNIS